jgi:hypothetical protein
MCISPYTGPAGKIQNFKFAMNHARFMMSPEFNIVQETLAFGIIFVRSGLTKIENRGIRK